MHLNSGTTIKQLKLRGQRKHCQKVERDIALLDWPEPNDGAWIFVNSLNVQTRAERAGKMLQTQFQQCVSQTNESDNVKRFANLEALLASLVTDLLRGTAPHKWYWQQWAALFSHSLESAGSASVSQAIRQVFSSHAHHVGAVLIRLQNTNDLESFWQTLSEPDADILLTELSMQGGYHHVQISGTHTEIPTIPNPPSLATQIWQRSLRVVPEKSFRQQLIFLLFGQAHWPLALNRAPQQTLIAVAQWWNTQKRLATQYETRHIPPVNSKLNSNRKKITESTVLHTQKNTDGYSPHAANSPLPANDNARIRGDAEFSETNHTDATEKHRLTNEQNVVTEDETAHPIPTNQTLPSKIRMSEDIGEDSHTPVSSAENIDANQQPTFNVQFVTAKGGVFYLFNILKHPEIQTLMGQHWASFPSGWYWFYGLVDILDIQLDAPLEEFLLAELGLTSAADLSSLPPIPEQQRIRELLALWFNHRFDDTLFGNSPVFNLRVQVRASLSHIDIYAPLNQVRLDVRMAGLDINPGWLTWLGRVVQFYFQEQTP